MKLYYFKSEEGNFGDDLNPWLWERLIPGLFDGNDDTLFVGIGTLLNHRIPSQPRKLVFGSGAGYGEPPKIDAKWTFACVRGPLTAQRLGLNPDLAITDAAALVSTLSRPEVVNEGRVAFIPHVTSTGYADWTEICRSAGLYFIDPRWQVEKVIAEISRCRLILAEAMHGAIMADTLRVPWIPVVCYPHISRFKWEDWAASLNIDYSPMILDGVWDAERSHSTAVVLRNSVKRSLLRRGFAPAGMTHPPPKKSPPEHFDRLVRQLIEVAEKGSSRLSSDTEFRSAVVRLQERIDRIARNPIAELTSA